MAITLRRQLSEDEKQNILKTHGRKCFATGHAIADGQVVHFDHIRAFVAGGLTELGNIAPMCETHNKAKGTLPLEDFRVKLRLDDFFAHGDAVTLKHLLAYLKKSGDIKAYGESVVVTEANDSETVRLDAGKATFSHALYRCPTTGWKYFYATLAVELLDSDDDDEDQKLGLQPRFLIPEKVFELYRHF